MPNRYPSVIAVYAALFYIAQAGVLALLAMRQLDYFGHSWIDVGMPPTTLTLMYLFGAGSVVSLLSGVGLIGRQPWVRWLILLTTLLLFAVPVSAPPGAVLRFLGLSLSLFFGMPLLLLLAAIAVQFVSFDVARDFTRYRPDA